MAKPKLKAHVIDREWCKGCGICVHFCPKNVLGCKGCGICVHFCPKNVLELDEEDKVVAARREDCICCKMCELRCPDLAIEIETE